MSSVKLIKTALVGGCAALGVLYIPSISLSKPGEAASRATAQARGVTCAKAENTNLTGSIKDRMAFRILKRAYEEGKI